MSAAIATSIQVKQDTNSMGFWMLTPKQLSVLQRFWHKPFQQRAWILLLTLCMMQCGYDASKEGTDTATYGTVTIASDESFQNLVEAEKMVFEAHYTHATIQVRYKPQDEAYLDFIRDSVRCIITSKRLPQEDSLKLVRAQIIPKVVKIATDGVALVVHPSNPDSQLTAGVIRKLFNGSAQNWSQLSSSGLKAPIQIIFDNNNSSNLKYIKQKFELTTLTSNIYVAGSNPAVIDYVSKNKNAIGVIGSNWISDQEDSTSRSFLKSVKVVAISSNEFATDSTQYYQPYQAYIATGDYPLCRDVYIINRETRTGLGTGFASFCAGDIGQRILLKMGLVPATAPIRIIKTKNKPLSEL